MRNRLNTWGNKSGFLIGGKRSKISKNCNLVSSVHAYLVAFFDIFSTAAVLSLCYPSSHWRICYFFDILATWPCYFFLISLHSCCLCSTFLGNGTAPVHRAFAIFLISFVTVQPQSTEPSLGLFGTCCALWHQVTLGGRDWNT